MIEYPFVRQPFDRNARRLNWVKQKQMLAQIHEEIEPKLAARRAADEFLANGYGKVVASQLRA